MTQPAIRDAADRTPAFLRRLRAKRAPQLPRWIDWHFAAIVIALAVVGLIFWVLSPILAPFLAAAILAYIFNPIVDRLASRGIPRSIGTIIAAALMLLVVTLLLLIVLPRFYREIAHLSELIPGFVEQLKTTTVPWLNDKFGITIALDASTLRQFMADNLGDAGGIAQRVFSTVGSSGLAVVGFLVKLVLIPVVLFYVLRDWHTLLAQIDALIPRRFHGSVGGIAREIDAVLSEFLRGQLAVIVIMSLFYVTGLWAVGLKFALPVGLITGVLVFVPYLGSATGLLLGTIAAVMQFDSASGMTLLWMVWGLFAAGQLIEGLLVTPKLVGDRIGLHPVAVIFALLAFGQLFGFFGVLLALPASAAILVGLRHLRANYTRSGVYRT